MPADIGGTHRKYSALDETRQKWLFKPQSLLQAFTDVAAASTALQAGVASPIIYMANCFYAGKRMSGSIQPYLECERAELSKDLNELTAMQRNALQRHHVVDWLLANADPHLGQFLIAQNGMVVAIDKSQSMRWFPFDPLAWNVRPWPVGTRRAAYWHLRHGEVGGHFRLDPAVAIAFAQDVSSRVGGSWLESTWLPVFIRWPRYRLIAAMIFSGPYSARELTRLTQQQLAMEVVKVLERRCSNLTADFTLLYSHR